MTLSRDYKKLFEFLIANEKIKVPCFVDYTVSNKNIQPIRDIAGVWYINGYFDVGVRGISYADMGINTLDHFISDCSRMNLEYVE